MASINIASVTYRHAEELARVICKEIKGECRCNEKVVCESMKKASLSSLAYLVNENQRPT